MAFYETDTLASA